LKGSFLSPPVAQQDREPLIQAHAGIFPLLRLELGSAQSQLLTWYCCHRHSQPFLFRDPGMVMMLLLADP